MKFQTYSRHHSFLLFFLWTVQKMSHILTNTKKIRFKGYSNSTLRTCQCSVIVIHHINTALRNSKIFSSKNIFYLTIFKVKKIRQIRLKNKDEFWKEFCKQKYLVPDNFFLSFYMLRIFLQIFSFGKTS